jgi:hypothetical protein
MGDAAAAAFTPDDLPSAAPLRSVLWHCQGFLKVKDADRAQARVRAGAALPSKHSGPPRITFSDGRSRQRDDIRQDCPTAQWLFKEPL